MTPGRMPPPRPPSGRDAAPPAGMPPPSAPPQEKAPEGGGKASHEECLFVNADQHCGNCMHYHAEDGSCENVDGQMDPEDACLRFFETAGEEQEEVQPDGEEDMMVDEDEMAG